MKETKWAQWVAIELAPELSSVRVEAGKNCYMQIKLLRMVKKEHHTMKWRILVYENEGNYGSQELSLKRRSAGFQRMTHI